MKQHLLKEIELGSKNALLKKRIIEHYIYNGSSTITDLSKELDLSVPTVTKFISEMCEDGYINDYGNVREYLISNTKKEELDKEVQEIIDEGYELAEKIVLANKKLLEIIAERLLEEEILTGEQLEEICKLYESNGKTSE